MRKYGLVQPTDKQSGPYDDHPWHFWMLMMILILFYQAFFLSLIFHFWSIPLCLLWWNGFRSKQISVNSFLIWVTFTFQHDLFFQNGGKNHYRSSVLLSESLSGVSPFSRQSVGCHLRIVGNWKHFQFSHENLSTNFPIIQLDPHQLKVVVNLIDLEISLWGWTLTTGSWLWVAKCSSSCFQDFNSNSTSLCSKEFQPFLASISWLGLALRPSWLFNLLQLQACCHCHHHRCHRYGHRHHHHHPSSSSAFSSSSSSAPPSSSSPWKITTTTTTALSIKMVYFLRPLWHKWISNFILRANMFRHLVTCSTQMHFRNMLNWFVFWILSTYKYKRHGIDSTNTYKVQKIGPLYISFIVYIWYI